MLFNIQILRAIASLLVVHGHAAGVTQLPTTAPVIVAPVVVVSVIATRPESLLSASVTLPLASRAPPAA